MIAVEASGGEWLSRLSLNQKTVDSIGVSDAVALCVRHAIPAIGLWREPVAALGVRRASRLVRDAGLRVSSLCRGGFLTATESSAATAALDNNRRAIDEAAELGTGTLIMVVGGLPAGSRDLRAARDRVTDRIAELAPYAGTRGVRLALEPLHPMFCADRAVLSTMQQALDIAERFPVEQVGIVVDTYHIWWDPAAAEQIARAADRIDSFQVCDWSVPVPADNLLGRTMMGDGHIDFRYFRRLVDDAGYRGDIEVELFNADIWAADPDVVVGTIKSRYASEVLG